MRADGMEVDDEDPAPENAVAQPQPTALVGEWEKQLVCPRKSNSAISDTIGVWKEKTWPMIATMSEFALFCLTFPEEFIKTVVIPATNQ